jgi:hypothetical protein
MKRCPECEFLYPDEQERCDMDGTVLRFTSWLPPLAPRQPTARKDLKSTWRGLAISLLGLVVTGSVFVTLYRATPRSSSAPGNQTAGANQDTKLSVSDRPQLVTEPAIPGKPVEPSSEPATHGRDPFAQPSQPEQSTNAKQLTIEPAARVQMEPPSPVIKSPKPAPGQTSPPPAASQKAVTRSNTAEPDKPAPQSKTETRDKDSKVKSVFKKAGRFLKKPF